MELYFTKYPELASLLARFVDPNHSDFNMWDRMTTEEFFIYEAQQYQGGAYAEPRFDSLEEFAQAASPLRGLPPEDILTRLNEMLADGVLEMR
jgi:hypothetical protein